MQIVIEIPEDEYNRWQEDGEMDALIVRDAIVNGAPLPKGHGRLIDADEIRCEREDFDTYFDYSNVFDEIDNAPTIIEADKEYNNEI